MITWTGDDAFWIGDVEYVCRPGFRRFRSTPRRFCLVKARWAVEEYARLLRELSPQNIVEVGMYDGGSAALLAEVAHPKKLVTFDVKEARSVALDKWIRARGFEDRVVAESGIDQADTARLAQLVDREFPGEQLELVIDDASHTLEPTRKTFNCLFPQLAPGGLYVIEDWLLPLERLVRELMIVAAHNPGIIADVAIKRSWIVVRRGHASVDPGVFDVSTLFIRAFAGIRVRSPIRRA